MKSYITRNHRTGTFGFTIVYDDRTFRSQSYRTELEAIEALNNKLNNK